jgi:predicted dehydrogenase
MKPRHVVTVAAAGTAAVTGYRAIRNADDIRLACVGLRGRGGDHIHSFLEAGNVELAALCDIDESLLNRRAREIESRGRQRPALYTDYRKLLEDRTIQAVSIATPNHHHTLQTIWACQAGKDVYVEKPCSHTVFESQQIVAAARKYDRIVQHGSQNRSLPTCREAIQRLHEGEIGEVYMARVVCYKWRDTIGRAPGEVVPKGVHYDLWVGPAPMKPFTRNRFHYNWHWQWDYGNGEIGNQAIHELDIARWGLGARLPRRVSAIGGRYMFDDDQETPNTMNVTFEFETNGKKQILVCECRHWLTNAEAGMGGPDGGRRSNSIGNIFYGSKGYLVLDGLDINYRTWIGEGLVPGATRSQAGNRFDQFVYRVERRLGAPQRNDEHFRNFLAAVRSHKRDQLNAEIEEGAISTMLVHLANISYRLGRTVDFDPQSMTCSDAEAQAMFTKPYREGFVVEKVV